MMRFRHLFEANEWDRTAFHTSANDIESPTDHPMFMAVKRGHADAWHQNMLYNGQKAKTYSGSVEGKIGHHEDPETRKVLSSAGVDHNDYMNDMASNPDRHEIESHPGTHALKKSGYHGFIMSDYDPTDFQKDADSLLVFNPAHSLKNWSKIS